MNLLKRILHYTPKSLVKIAWFKIIRQIVLMFEKYLLMRNYSINPSVVNLSAAHETFINNFWSTVPLGVVYNKDVEELLRGNVVIFGKVYPLMGYLRDPVSGRFWPENEFFAESQIKINGYSDVKFVLELNKLNHLVEAAKVYYLTGNVQYVKYIEEQLSYWKRDVCYERSVANRIIMDVAFRCINLVFISLFCMNNDSFRNRVYPEIHEILILSERQMRRFSTPRWFKTGNGANHVVGEMVGLIIVQRWLAFIEDNVSWLKYIDQEYKWLEGLLQKLIAPSGVYLENSANYTRVVSEFLICLQIFEKSFGKHNTKIEEYYLKSILGYLSDLQCYGVLPNFGDNDAATVLIPFKSNFDDITPLINFYNENYSEKLGGKEALLKYLSDGQLIWRSYDKNDLQLFMRFGKWSIFKPGTSCHLHSDLLSVIFFVNSEPVFIDKGSLFYNQSEEIKRKSFATASHNTVFVEGHDQAFFDSGWHNYPRTILEDCLAPVFFRAKMTTADGFSHTRSLSYECEEIVIEDFVTSPFDEDVKIRYLLHDSVIPRLVNNHSIELKLPSTKIIVIDFEGIDNLQIYKDTYYPHYGKEVDTYAIQCIVIGRHVITHINVNCI